MAIMKHAPEPESLKQMRERGGSWAAYCNMDLGHPELGHLKFIKWGKGCTFAEPPKPQLPDFPTAINWRYQYVGEVNLETGEVEEHGKREARK